MDLKAEDFSDAVKEIIRKLAQSHLLRDEMLCLADVLKRESVFSTCMPGGIAMPHARTNGVSRLISAIAVSRKGIANADGTELTRIFVLTLSPEESGQPYLQYISHIGKLLIKAENTERIRQAQTPDELRNIFLGR